MYTKCSSHPGNPGYITVAEADAYAAAELDHAVWDALTDDQKTAALIQATDEIDAVRWQGRIYESDQERAFPRVVDELPGADGMTGGEAVVFDDDANDVAVPDAVLKAAYLQAASIAEGARAGRSDDRHDGVASESAAGVSESYTGKPKVLCRRAHLLLKKWYLRSARLS